ncbi:pentatricopeptide repeat-containing protein [Populus alba x Populus x berolinensis]|nr:pentatricopeptide repeat-containing protein [Populus alba x Populus x berolinensis]
MMREGMFGVWFMERLVIVCCLRLVWMVMSMCGEMGFAWKVFDEMGDRDLVSWNSMISGYSKMGFAKEAIGLFMEMREEGWVEGLVLEKKMEVNSCVGSALIDMYGKCGDLISARRVFDSMPNKDVVTWNAIITWS